ncbi:MAG: CAP domain-containing protein, partial [Planctomycetota bacterium]
RGRVDKLRGESLGLIRDTAQYPYPFRSPDASDADVERYQAAQAAIDRAIKSLEKEWKKSPRVRYPKSIQDARSMLLLVAETAEQLSQETRMTFTLSLRGAQGWALGMPSPGEIPKDKITLASLALSFEEGQALAESRAIVARNAELRDAHVKAAKRGQERRTLGRVFEQVRVTNHYRQLLGLRALAWSPELQEAADGHARYLEETGEFTHYQPTEELKDFTARARTAGYEGKVYENCQRGANSAEEALRSLCHSSEHHRNLTTDRLTEMAVGNKDRVWVQNFGTGERFREGLEVGAWWRMEM